jgi:Na+/proline symporter
MFITIGLLLHVVYQRPELMGGATLELGTTFEGQKISTFMHYILTQLPAGLRGLVTAGVFAAAIATTNSALNAMSSVMVQDFYRPWKEKRAQAGEHHYVQAGRWGMAIAGIAMFGFAVVSFYWQRASDKPLLEFALQVMVFAYAGLLGVYFTALFSARGNTNSVIAALIAGFVAVACCQPYFAAALHLPDCPGATGEPGQPGHRRCRSPLLRDRGMVCAGDGRCHDRRSGSGDRSSARLLCGAGRCRRCGGKPAWGWREVDLHRRRHFGPTWRARRG